MQCSNDGMPCHVLQGELGDATRAHDTAHSQLMALQAALSAAQSELSDARAGAARERRAQEERLAAAEAHWEGKVAGLVGEVRKRQYKQHVVLCVRV